MNLCANWWNPPDSSCVILPSLAFSSICTVSLWNNARWASFSSVHIQVGLVCGSRLLVQEFLDLAVVEVVRDEEPLRPPSAPKVTTAKMRFGMMRWLLLDWMPDILLTAGARRGAAIGVC